MVYSCKRSHTELLQGAREHNEPGALPPHDFAECLSAFIFRRPTVEVEAENLSVLARLNAGGTMKCAFPALYACYL